MPYRLAPSHQLPTVDLSKTLLSYVVTRTTHDRAVRWLRRHLHIFVWFNRIGTVAIIAGLPMPRPIGLLVLLASTPFCLIGMTATTALLNVPMLRLLARQYDFWVFSSFNLLEWLICGALLGDLRAVACVPCWLNTWLIIGLDANTRTIPTLVRGAMLWLPGVIIITVGSLLHVWDVDEANYAPFKSIGHSQLNMTFVNMFANVTVTLSVYVGLRCFFKREVLTSHFYEMRMIPSSIYRVRLTFESMDESNGHRVTSTRVQDPSRRSIRVSDGNVLLSSMSRQAVRSRASLSSDVQQLQLIHPKVRTVASADSVIRGPIPISSPVLFVIKVSGVIGWLLSSYGLVAPICRGETIIAAVVGLALSLFFIALIVANCNRHVLLSLGKNLDVLYLSFQAITSAYSICCSLDWQHSQVVSIVSYLVWFHLMLALDGLLPDAWRRLQLKKVCFAPLMLGLVVGIVGLLAALGLSDAIPGLHDHVILCLARDRFCIHSLSFLFLRFAALLVGVARLFWLFSTSCDNELSFFCGRVEFFTPVHQLPFEIADVIESTDRAEPIMPRSDGPELLFERRNVNLEHKPAAPAIPPC